MSVEIFTVTWGYVTVSDRGPIWSRLAWSNDRAFQEYIRASVRSHMTAMVPEIAIYTHTHPHNRCSHAYTHRYPNNVCMMYTNKYRCRQIIKDTHAHIIYPKCYCSACGTFLDMLHVGPFKQLELKSVFLHFLIVPFLFSHYLLAFFHLSYPVTTKSP